MAACYWCVLATLFIKHYKKCIALNWLKFLELMIKKALLYTSGAFNRTFLKLDTCFVFMAQKNALFMREFSFLGLT